MPHLGPEEFENNFLSGPEADARAAEDAIAEYHRQTTGRNLIHGPVDKLLPESQAVIELIIMQANGLSPEEELALEGIHPTIDGRPFIPERASILNFRGVFSDVKVSGRHELQASEVDQVMTVEVEQCYLFVGAARRFFDQKVRRTDPPARVRTRIFEA